MWKKIIALVKQILEYALTLFDYLYVIKEDGKIIGSVGMDGSFISADDISDKSSKQI